MIRKILPLILGIVGLLAGGGAGLYLRPKAEAMPMADSHDAPADAGHDAPAADMHAAAEEGHAPKPADDHAAKPEAEAMADDGHGAAPMHDYVKLNNQFVIPVVSDGRVAALVVLSLSLEAAPGSSEAIFAREPKLRDAMLQVLFDHSNAGGFKGVYTDGANLTLLRRALKEVALKIMGEMVTDVLITDIVRQDT